MFKDLKSGMFTLMAISTITLIGFFYSGHSLNANADEKAKIYICNCHGGCLCEYETRKPGGRCVCGLITIPSDREPNEGLEYECDCGTICDCGSRADEPGLCHCGTVEMRVKE